jgi:hypothetical protein
MTNKMQDAGSVVVNLIIIDVEVYQRQRDVNGLNLGEPTWFIAECTTEKDSWVWLGKEAQDAIEARYQAEFYPAPEPMTDEEHEEAMCEDAASRDYENTFYAQ